MLTSTNTHTSANSQYQLDELLATLHNSGLILLPTDTVWSIGSDATDPVAVHRLLRLYRSVRSPQPLEILVDSIGMLKQYVQGLHPRLETLLAYHRRPLSVMVNAWHSLPEPILPHGHALVFRLIRDDYCRQMIDQLGHPLLTMFASFEGDKLPSHFGAICSSVLTAVDQVAGLDLLHEDQGEASVIVRMTAEDTLEFMRE